MLLIILALFWVVLLTPSVVRRIRERNAERSIQHFHEEHEVLSRQDYAVAPAHRLDRPDPSELYEHMVPRRPHLTVVHADDTYGSLESRSSWEEWSHDYEFDEAGDDAKGVREVLPNRYARAYATQPDAVTSSFHEELPPLRRARSSRRQRRRVFLSLVSLAALCTLGAVFVSSSLVIDATAAAWFLVVAYLALALYAVSRGWVAEASLPTLRRASVAPLYRPSYDSGYAFEDYDDEHYEGDDGAYEDAVGYYGSGEGRRAFG